MFWHLLKPYSWAPTIRFLWCFSISCLCTWLFLLPALHPFVIDFILTRISITTVDQTPLIMDGSTTVCHQMSRGLARTHLIPPSCLPLLFALPRTAKRTTQYFRNIILFSFLSMIPMMLSHPRLIHAPYALLTLAHTHPSTGRTLATFVVADAKLSCIENQFRRIFEDKEWVRAHPFAIAR